MSRNFLVIQLIALLLLLGVGYLFFVQNSLRKVQLSLDLGFAAWQLTEPLAVPILIAICFGVGFALGAVIFGFQSMNLSREVRRLKAEASLNATERSSNWKS